MPQLICRGMQAAQVQDLSRVLAPTLSAILDAPEDWFRFEHLPSLAFSSGEPISDSALVDVLWFPRGQAQQDETAAAVHAALAAQGYRQIEVVFHPLVKENYYENGEHY